MPSHITSRLSEAGTKAGTFRQAAIAIAIATIATPGQYELPHISLRGGHFYG